MIKSYLVAVITHDNEIQEYMFFDSDTHSQDDLILEAQHMLKEFIGTEEDSEVFSAFVSEVIFDISSNIRVMLDFTVNKFND